jgi:phage-related protein (TIGR01555 family)
MPKVSIRQAVRDAIKADAEARAPIASAKRTVPLVDGTATKVATLDSFNNYAQKLGVGADNPLTTASYGFNPITRLRTQLEWMHRGSWIAGVAIDIIADDMTKAGVEFKNEIQPEDMKKLHKAATNLQLWEKINETIKWARLYGGAIAVMLIDGQDFSTPLKLESVGKGRFKGLLVLDRWMVEPSLQDLVTEMGPNLGLPKFYTVQANAPALRGKTIHYSRLAFRLVGVKVPYQQQLTEQLWGISVIERLYDRMVGFDGASTGIAQLVYKAYLRTLSIKGMREVVAMGNEALDGLVKYVNLMRTFQSIEGMTMIDGEDTFEAQTTQAFSGLAEASGVLAEQLSGALQIPLTRLFGQSPKGFSDGDNDVRNYHESIHRKQEAELQVGVTTMFTLLAQSEGVAFDDQDELEVEFNPLGQLTEVDKASVATQNAQTIVQVHEAGLISDQVALQELKQQSRVTGMFTNITDELIEAADDTPQDPMEQMPVDPETGLPAPPEGSDPESDMHGSTLPQPKMERKSAKPQAQAKPMAQGAKRGTALH